jgi:hypothetical protein
MAVPALPLEEVSRTTTDRAVIAWLMDYTYGRKGWGKSVVQNGKTFRLWVMAAPGWLDDGTLATAVELLRPPRER